MNELLKQIQRLLPMEKQFFHDLYEKTIRDYAYLWEEFPEIAKLRRILLLIIHLFIEEHRNLTGLNLQDQEN